MPAMHKIAIPQAAVDRVLKRRGALHVFNDIDPARTAHVVVDLQNGFMAPGQPAEIPAARDIVANVNRISLALRAGGGLVIYIQNTIDAAAKQAWSNWFKYMSGEGRAAAMDAAFAPGSYGHSLWPELDVQPADLKVKKNRFGAFVPGSSDLHAELQARNIDTVIITGTATNVCLNRRRATP
jgi:ureidoacrylate peracid hydrolase